MNQPLHHHDELKSNAQRDTITRFEPRSQRTFTPTQAVIARSAGIFHWTQEGRRLYDFTSGVLVANLGHNPTSWLQRFFRYMGWGMPSGAPGQHSYSPALPLNAYNAVTLIEAETAQRLVSLLQSRPGGKRLEQVLWAASGSEAIQKALWMAQARDRERDIILATRFGFHGKKGLAGAVSGCETDSERDTRVRFISFPMAERADLSQRDQPFDPAPYRQELITLLQQFGRRLGALITEPYLGGGGSYHPPPEYLQLVQQFCRDNDLVFILDEVQSNFGRTGHLFAYETYGLEPDMVVLGKGLGNGVPVAAVVGRTDLFASLGYGDGSDTWSGNPLACAGVAATLDEFAAGDILGVCREASAIVEKGLIRLKELPFVAKVRGEKGGMVWGAETRDHSGRSASSWANAAVLACYLGDRQEGIHVLGPLAKKVVRIAPPLIITPPEADQAMELMFRVLRDRTESCLCEDLSLECQDSLPL